MQNNHVPESDQRQLNGECSKCRRKNYCKKKCKATARRINTTLTNLVAERTGIGVMLDILNRYSNERDGGLDEESII